jgi:hypothetical protein
MTSSAARTRKLSILLEKAPVFVQKDGHAAESENNVGFIKINLFINNAVITVP